ncbi:hypothetical protein SLS54_006403 [Diplodia seriata]
MFPSKLHLAYALAVIRSKPPDLSVKDYILHLREHVRPKSKSNTNTGSERRLDSASYWAQRFHQADAARAKLEAKLTEHEREIERLKSELHSAQNTSATRATPSMRKRKDAVLPKSSAPAVKRRKIVPNDSYASSVETVDDTLPDDVEALSAVHEVSTFEAAARIFMSLFFGAKKLAAEKRPTPEERGAITYSFVHMFGQVLDILRESSSSQAAQEAALTLAANSRRQMTTRGSQKLFGRTAKQDALATRLLSNFLSNILNAPLPPPAANGSETPPQHRHHQDLVEGFLFVLFRRLGDRVFLCTFGHRKCASVEADIDAWVDPAAKEKEEEGEGVPDEEEDPPLPSETDDREKQIQQRALAIELPLLVALLERGLAVARRHIAPVSSSSSSSSSSTTTAGGSRKQGVAAGTRTTPRTTTAAAFSSAPRSSRPSSSSRPSAETLKAGLSLLARKKLERTLAQAIFSFPGGDGEEDGDGDGGEGEASRDEMSECMMMPVRQALVEPVAGPQRAKKKAREGGDEDVKAWFVERVWGLVGWEAVLEMR